MKLREKLHYAFLVITLESVTLSIIQSYVTLSFECKLNINTPGLVRIRESKCKKQSLFMTLVHNCPEIFSHTNISLTFSRFQSNIHL